MYVYVYMHKQTSKCTEELLNTGHANDKTSTYSKIWGYEDRVQRYGATAKVQGFQYSIWRHVELKVV